MKNGGALLLLGGGLLAALAFGKRKASTPADESEVQRVVREAKEIVDGKREAFTGEPEESVDAARAEADAKRAEASAADARARQAAADAAAERDAAKRAAAQANAAEEARKADAAKRAAAQADADREAAEAALAAIAAADRDSAAPAPAPAPKPPAPGPAPAPAPKPPTPAPAPPAPAPISVVSPAPAPAPAPAPMPSGFEPALARKEASRVSSHLQSRGSSYSRPVLSQWQTYAGLTPDGIYGGATRGALLFYGAKGVPSAMFKPTKTVPYVPPDYAPELARKHAQAIASNISRKGKDYDQRWLKQWQAYAALVPDGVYGPASRGALIHFGVPNPAPPLTTKKTTTTYVTPESRKV